MIPYKIYLEEGHAEPIVGFVGPAWNNPKDLENPIEFIRKDKILKVLEDSKNLADAALKIDEL